MKKMKLLVTLSCVAALCLYGCDNNDGNSSYENISDDANELEDVCEFIPDDYFREYCLSNFDTNNDGKLSQSEADKVKQISVMRARGSAQYSGMKVDFSGIEYFRNLEYFESNAAWDTFDLSKNSHVSYLALDYSGVTDVILRNTNITSIDDKAFYECANLTSIELPDGLTIIGEKAFYDCTSLTSIEFPDGLTSIGNSAFYNCTSLVSIELPGKITSIGNSAFNKCSNLANMTVKALTPPSLSSYALPSTGSYKSTLYVPSESIDAYKASDWNKYFSDVLAIEE